MEPPISEAELLAFLRAIEVGDVKLAPVGEPQEVYAGVVTYRASNGWQIAIFNDANEWDYVEWVVTADGRHVEFMADIVHMPEVYEYAPTESVAWQRYGIPGYMKFRCKKCGRELERSERQRGGPAFYCHRHSDRPPPPATS